MTYDPHNEPRRSYMEWEREFERECPLAFDGRKWAKSFIHSLLSEAEARGRSEAVDFLLSKFTNDVIVVRHPENIKVWEAARHPSPEAGGEGAGV